MVYYPILGSNHGDERVIFIYLVWIACSMNLSCVNVNSIICMVRLGVGRNGPYCFFVALWMYTISKV